MPTPTSMEIAGWLICLFAFVGGVNSVMKLVDRFKDKPAPGDVRAEAHEVFVTKETFAEHLAHNTHEHENLFSKLGGIERGLIARMDQRLGEISERQRMGQEKLHDRINEVLAAISRIEGVVHTWTTKKP